MIELAEAQVRGWLSRARGGDDPRAIDLLFEHVYSHFRPLATPMIKAFPTVAAYEETGDLYHEALVKLFRRYTRRPETVPEDTLQLLVAVRGALRDVLIDLTRKHLGPESFAANHAGPIDVDPIQEQTSVTGALRKRERGELVLAAIESLPEDLQTVVLLYYSGDGMKTQAIADLLEVHVKTVRRWLQDAVHLLRDKLVKPEA